VPATAARDTVKRVAPGTLLVRDSIPREEIWLAQTPQGFRRDVLDQMMTTMSGDREFTDEAMLAEQTGHAAEVVPGDESNLKITTADDLMAARARIGAAPRVGTGYDLHQLVAGRPLAIAGVVVPFDRGPLGHSDGDVVCHALADAMFGAAGIGDIGQHFPNTDPRWKDIPGLDLLRESAAIVARAGWRVASADVTVILERPRLAPYLPAIRQALAATLGLEMTGVNVKPKTNEGVDAVGRGEAIAAHAVAVLTPGASR
jgi:2-C-methyl-D-erythritol 4-phosphate cytidylyltransferase/2-C-methyl-D-erythritol 2,4-cyclodiphosphate synthase